MIESIRPKNFGIVVRTAAEGKKVAELHEEINLLLERWKHMHQQLVKAKPPLKLLSELDKTSSMIRDLLNKNFTGIHINDREMYLSIKEYLNNNLPEKTVSCISIRVLNPFLILMVLKDKLNLLLERLLPYQVELM